LSSAIFFVEGFERGVGFGAFAKENDAFDHIVVVDDGAVFPADGFSELTEADLGGLHDFAKIADADRSPIDDFDEGRFEIGSGGHQADGANVESLLAPLNEASASVRVVVGECLLHLAERQAIGDEFAGIEAHLVLACRAAEDVDVDKIGHGLELVADES
jgi:hypothetical protein